jgi:phospholipid transport system substrate-binding protein
MTLRPLLVAASLAAIAAPAAAVHAEAADPGAAQIERLDAALLDTMKQAKALGVQGRYRKLEPVVQQLYDLPTMTRFAVGPKWATVSPADQAALIKAFTRLNVASYAHNFDGYDGETFVLGKAETRGPDKLVHTQLVPTKGKPTDLVYRMRQSGGAWKIIDVYYNGGISELTTRRSDFSGTMDSGGAPALIKKIDALADKQMRGG